jgi:hypothetical protein
MHEARVVTDSQLASVHHRLRGLDSDLTLTQEVAQAASQTAALSHARLEKVLLEQGAQVVRVAGLEQAHTHYLADRVVADRERHVLSHVTTEAVGRLNELARGAEAHSLAVRGELDGLHLLGGRVVGRLDTVDARLDSVQGCNTAQEGRLGVVEGIAAGLVPLVPTGEELCQVCLAFEDKVMRTTTVATAVTLTGAGLPSVHLNMVLDDQTSERVTRFAVRLAAHVARTADEEVLCGVVQEPRGVPGSWWARKATVTVTATVTTTKTQTAISTIAIAIAVAMVIRTRHSPRQWRCTMPRGLIVQWGVLTPLGRG